MKVCIESWGETCTIETEADDINLSEFAELLRKACLGAGWSSGLVDQIIVTEE